MIRLKLTSSDERDCFVSFYDSYEMNEPSEPEFDDLGMRFPWDEVPNMYGHMPDSNKEISPEDFMFKAFMFGFAVEVA